MSKGLNVNGCNNINTRFHIIKVFPPAVTEPSVQGMPVITSQPSGARRVTQETLEEAKSTSKGAFSSTSAQSVNSEQSADLKVTQNIFA